MTSLTLACSGWGGTLTAETGTVFDAESANSISSDSQGAPMATTSQYDDITSGDPPSFSRWLRELRWDLELPAGRRAPASKYDNPRSVDNMDD
mgnify:CR=1 FL=1